MSQASAVFCIPARILLPMDFSPSSYAALEEAADLARHFKAELRLLHIIPTAPDFNGSDFFPRTLRLEEVRDDIETKLAECENTVRARGVKASSAIETGNDLAETVVHVIERDHVDMIVITTHGMSGWRPMVFGSTAEKIMKLVQCPLLLLPSLKLTAASEDPISLGTETSFGLDNGSKASSHHPSTTPETVSQKRLDLIAEKASERAGKTEQRYDQDHSIFTK